MPMRGVFTRTPAQFLFRFLSTSMDGHGHGLGPDSGELTGLAKTY